jgi:cell division protein FtsB
MEEIKNDPKKSKRAWSTVFFIVIVVYLVFILSRSLWQNYKVNQEIKSLEQEVTTLEEENQRLKNLVLYYRTDSYKEKEARRKLLMKMPDEKVLALPETEYNHEQAEDQIDNEKDRDKYQEPNYKLWIKYIFG